MESMSGEMNAYDIFMASPKTVGKDRRGNFIYRKDNQGKRGSAGADLDDE